MPDYRLSQRAPDRHSDQQLRALQRAIPATGERANRPARPAGPPGPPPGGGVGRDGQVDFNVSRVIAAHIPRLLFHKAMLLGGKKERRGQRPRR